MLAVILTSCIPQNDLIKNTDCFYIVRYCDAYFKVPLNKYVNEAFKNQGFFSLIFNLSETLNAKQKFCLNMFIYFLPGSKMRRLVID